MFSQNKKFHKFVFRKMTPEMKQLIRVKKGLLKRALRTEKELRAYLMEVKPLNPKVNKKLEVEAGHMQKQMERNATTVSLIDKIIKDEIDVVDEPKPKKIKLEETPLV